MLPAPDAKHPAQLEESYAVIEYFAAHGAEKGLKTERVRH
jgi:acetyl esterase/lipase